MSVILRLFWKKKTQTMADKVIEALINPTVLNQIVPILSEKIAESVAESINKAVEIPMLLSGTLML
jgi:hypothetical protein